MPVDAPGSVDVPNHLIDACRCEDLLVAAGVEFVGIGNKRRKTYRMVLVQMRQKQVLQIWQSKDSLDLVRPG